MQHLKTITLENLARLLDAKLVGDGTIEVSRISPLDTAGPDDLSFLSDRKLAKTAETTKAAAVIVSERDRKRVSGKALLVVKEAYVAFAKAQAFFCPPRESSGEKSPLAFVHPTATVDERVALYPFVSIGKGARIGKGSILFPNVSVGENVSIGEQCILYSGVKIYDACRLGDRVILHAGAVIGSDGFGYAWDGKEHLKIPQTGRVVVGDDVEIGANTTIDRGALGDTVIEKGAKIDNLVQIAHNVKVGEHSILVAQVGIAGSSRIGKGVVLAGQVGVAGHIRLGDGVQVAAQSGIHKNLKDGEIVAGTPPMPIKLALRTGAVFPHLPDIWQKVKWVIKKLGEVEERLLNLESRRQK
jgi:UDP-3-O-[3-hydroxymyristoyl] glucosamine N-acyltransferase